MLLTTKSLEAGTRGSYALMIKSEKLGEQRQRESERKNNDYHHTAPESPQLWCHNEPRGCWDCGTGPGCVS